MRGLMLAAALMLVGCVTAPAAQGPGHLYWRDANPAVVKPRPWAILLPGGGGIDIFGDEGAYYFSVADKLNARGFDVLVVHYQEDTRPAAEVGMANYGAEIARSVIDAVSYQRGLNRMDMRCDGILMSWSLGGEGLLELAGRDRMALPGLRAAIAYYPSVQGRPAGFDPKIEVDILQGDADRLTTPEALRRFLGAATSQEAVTVHTIAGAQHGFDITTLTESQLEGRFAYDAASAARADAVVDEVLGEMGYGCALD